MRQLTYATALATMLTINCNATIITSVSTYCDTIQQRIIGAERCRFQSIDLYDVLEGEGRADVTISGNTLSAVTMATSSIVSLSRFLNFSAGGESFAYVNAFTSGPARSGWARTYLLESFGFFPQPDSYDTTYNGMIDGLNLTWQHQGKLAPPPIPVIVPFQLGTAFEVWLRVTVDATFGTGGINQWAFAHLELFEDQALTMPVGIQLVPEPTMRELLLLFFVSMAVYKIKSRRLI